MISILPNASPSQSSIYSSSQQLSYKAAAKQDTDPYAMNNDLLIQQCTNQSQSNDGLSPQYQQQTRFIDQQIQANNYSVKSDPSTKFDLMANTPPPSPENQLQKQLQQPNGFQGSGDYPAHTQQSYAAGQSQWSNQISPNSIAAENQISNQISVQISNRPLDSPSSSNSSTSSSSKKLKSEKQPAIVHQHVHLNNIVINSLSVNNSLQINQQNNVHLQATAPASQLNASSQPVQTSSNSYHCNPLYVYTHKNNLSLESYPAPLQSQTQSGHSSNHLAEQVANNPNQANSSMSQSTTNCSPINRTANGYFSAANSMYLRQLEEEQHLLTTVHPMLNAHHLQTNGTLYPYEAIGVQPNSASQFNAQYGSNIEPHEYSPDDYPVGQLDELNNNCSPLSVNSNGSFATQCPSQQRLPNIYNSATPLIKNVSAGMQVENLPVNFGLANNASQLNNQINEQNAQVSSCLPIQAAAVSTTKSRRGRKARGPKKITQHFCNYNNCGKCYSKSSHLKGKSSFLQDVTKILMPVLDQQCCSLTLLNF